MLGNFKRGILIFLMLAGVGLLIHNLYFYKYLGGYNYLAHVNYAQILTSDWRFPSYEESYENYNPPLFYILTGMTARVVGYFNQQDFYFNLNAYKVLEFIFSVASIYLWYRIIKRIRPGKHSFHLFFVLLVFSLPVFQKMVVMLNTEHLLMFFYSLIFWFFIEKFYVKPSIKNTVILGLLTSLSLLTRISSLTLFLSLAAGISSLYLVRKIDFKQMAKYLIVFILVIISLTSWFYYGRRNEGIYKAGRVAEPSIPLWQRQPIEFYTYIPFKFMMTYPFRLQKPLNHLIPIFYSDFWGDWWNYFSQRRYGISQEATRDDHYLTNNERVASLALQNRVNLVFTMIMMAGFARLIYITLKQFFTRRFGESFPIQAIFVSISILTWLGFMLMQVKYPNWKSDAVKPSYMLNIIPIFIYAGLTFIFDVLRKVKFIYYPVLIWITLAACINLWWAYY